VEPIVAVDLIHAFGRAERRAGPGIVLGAEFADLGGDARPAIFAHAPSRLTWRMHIPRRATIRTAIGLKSETWSQQASDGVVFRVAISDRRRIYETLFIRHIDPYRNPDDRRWTPVEIDLSRFAGWQWSLFYRPYEREWDLIFSTDLGPSRASTPAWDWSVWGRPAIYAEP
jgi:hypothetical protein